jgi:hypothetical protein
MVGGLHSGALVVFKMALVLGCLISIVWLLKKILSPEHDAVYFDKYKRTRALREHMQSLPLMQYNKRRLSLDYLEEAGGRLFRNIVFTCSQSIWLNIATISSNMAPSASNLS